MHFLNLLEQKRFRFHFLETGSATQTGRLAFRNHRTTFSQLNLSQNAPSETKVVKPFFDIALTCKKSLDNAIALSCSSVQGSRRSRHVALGLIVARQAKLWIGIMWLAK